MPNLLNIQQRLAQQNHDALSDFLLTQLKQQGYHGMLTREVVEQACEQFGLMRIELALRCVALSACYALVPVSQFYVGAVAIGASGNFYFGANQEYRATGIAQTVHAEQSAISHAWLAGESAISDMVVNTTPCGHCRQFMNELNTATTLEIHLPHSQHNLLQRYLPDSFGPKDLGIERVLFDLQAHAFHASNDTLTQAAIAAAENAYAPYSQALSGVALQVGDRIVTGRYAENAAFNPSFLPLQGALNHRRLLGLADQAVSRVVMAEKVGVLSHRAMTADLAKQALGLELEYVSLESLSK